MSKCAHCGGLVVRWNSEERRCAACGRPPGPAPRVATGAVAERTRATGPVFNANGGPAATSPNDTPGLEARAEKKRRYQELRRLGIGRKDAARQVGRSRRQTYRLDVKPAGEPRGGEA